DLVGQAPGGPEEDPEGGFPFGGWQAPLMDEAAGAQVMAAYEGTDALLLGRRTYDIFAAYWPHQEGGQDNEIATLFNSVPKYVASRGTPDLSCAGPTHLGPDLVAALGAEVAAGGAEGCRDTTEHRQEVPVRPAGARVGERHAGTSVAAEAVEQPHRREGQHGGVERTARPRQVRLRELTARMRMRRR